MRIRWMWTTMQPQSEFNPQCTKSTKSSNDLVLPRGLIKNALRAKFGPRARVRHRRAKVSAPSVVGPCCWSSSHVTRSLRSRGFSLRDFLPRAIVSITLRFHGNEQFSREWSSRPLSQPLVGSPVTVHLVPVFHPAAGCQCLQTRNQIVHH